MHAVFRDLQTVLSEPADAVCGGAGTTAGDEGTMRLDQATIELDISTFQPDIQTVLADISTLKADKQTYLTDSAVAGYAPSAAPTDAEMNAAISEGLVAQAKVYVAQADVAGNRTGG